MTSGTTTDRAALRLIVHRGWAGNRPTNLSATLRPVANEGILSGMLITQKYNATRGKYEWIKGFDGASTSVDSASSAPLFFWAVDDQADPDVLASGTLLGLSGLGNYEMSTSQVTSGYAYSVGEELTYDGVTGKMRPAAHNELVIARVSREFNGPVDLGPSYTPVDAGTSLETDGVDGAAFTPGTRDGATDLTVVTFVPVVPYVRSQTAVHSVVYQAENPD